MTHPEIDLLSQAKQRLLLSALMAQLGFGDRAKKSARCPFHEDSSASFSLYVGDDGEERWKCFAGCGQGDAIDFLAKHRGLSNADACREYIHLAGVTPPPAPPPGSNPSPSAQPPFDWQSCVAALTAEHRQKLAEWRGYAPKFVEWLHAQNLIGLFDGERIAFAVHDAQGNVTGCHYRIKEDESWRYHPVGTRTAPFIIGDPATAKTVLVFESQWDLLAVLDCLHHHIQPLDDTAAVATRGAGNARLLAGLCAPDAVVYAFGQNDEAGAKWLAAVAANCGCKTFQVVTPSPHKDANDWTRAGVTAAEIRRAIAEAQLVAVSITPDLHAAPPKNVSKPAITLPDETDEPEAAPFPVDALPPDVALMVRAVASAHRVPDSLPGLMALAIVAASIGKGLVLDWRPGKSPTPANLFVMPSAESGAGKSECYKMLAACFLAFEREMQQHWREKILPKLEGDKRFHEVQLKKLERILIKGSTDSNEIERCRGALQLHEACKNVLKDQLHEPQLSIQDATVEKAASVMHWNDETIFSTSSDARKLVDNILGRYSANKKIADDGIYLNAFSGDDVKVDRQTGDGVRLANPCLTLLWALQPDALDLLLGEVSLQQGGFLARCLMAHTQAEPQLMGSEQAGVSEGTRAGWETLVRDLLTDYRRPAWLPSVELTNTEIEPPTAKRELKPYVIQPTVETRTALEAYHNEFVAGWKSGELSDVGRYASRWCEQAARLSLVLHAGLHGKSAHLHPLELETAVNAILLAKWFAGQQLGLLAKGRHAAAAKLEDQVLELLESNRQRKSQDFITAREVHRARITASADTAKALLARMEADGLLVAEDITPAHGGKTTRIYRAARNPVPE